MSVKVDPNLMKDLEHFGLKDAKKCFHCGNCTAVCPLSTADNPFPRRFHKYIQMGLTEKIMKSPEPWLCYYCGDCPHLGRSLGNHDGMRRWLVQVRLDRLFKEVHTSESFEIIAVATGSWWDSP
jgi:hypothetical protein